MSVTVYLGLGSNVQREQHLCAGLDALQALLGELRCSAVFESVAVGISSGNFYNLVVCAQTNLSLFELDRQLKTIEADNGRYAPQRKGLPLDIDMLLYGDQVGDFNGLQLPRGEIVRNAFVLWPLSLLAPQLKHPLNGRSFSELWQQMQTEQQLWPVAFSWGAHELTPAALLSAQS